MTKLDSHARIPEMPALGLQRAASSPLPVTASACGKAIIVGEHAVVYGARAVAMPVLNLRLSVQLKTREDDRSKTARLHFGGRAVPDHLQGVVTDAFEALGIEPFAADLEGSTSVLIGAGLGSSASLCIAILRAIAASRSLDLTREQLAALGNRLERRFHGNPSGLDTAVVACEDVIAFVKGQGASPAQIDQVEVTRVTNADGRREPWRFVLLDSGARSSTASMIQIAAPYFTGENGNRRLARFDAMAAEVIRGLAVGDANAVADAMNEATVHLDEAGIVNPELRELIDAAREVGALAAKPTGAGGGGCVLALLDSANAAAQLAALNEKFGSGRVYTANLS